MSYDSRVDTLVAGSGITSAYADAHYAAIVHSHAFSSLTAKPTTVAGYGITDAFTQSAADALYAPVSHSHTFASLTSKPTTLAGFGITDGVATSDSRLSDARAPLAHTQAFSTITATPATVSGYGITDAETSTHAAATYAPIVHSHTFASLTSKPTTIAGYGITDAFTQSAADLLYATLSHTHTFASLTSKPTTIAGYGITDAVGTSDSRLGDARSPLAHDLQGSAHTTSQVLTVGWVFQATSASAFSFGAMPSHTQTWSTITATPTTLSGYGITDSQTKAAADAAYATITHSHALTAASITGVLPVAKGGTNLSTIAAGALLYASALDTPAALAIGAAGTVLRSSGSVPAWSTSTFADTYAVGALLHASAANVVGALAPGAIGTKLAGRGAAAPAYEQHIVRTTADQASTAVSTLVNITGLSITLGANEEWELEAAIRWLTAATTTTVGFAVTCSAAPTLLIATVEGFTGTAQPLTAGKQQTVTASATAVAGFGGMLTTTETRIKAYIVAPAGGCTVTIQWSQSVATASASTIKRGSTLISRRAA